MSYVRKRTVEGLKIGETFSVSRTFTEEDMMRFAEITRDYNPIHFDDRFAKVKKMEGRICHGLLVASLLTEIGGQIGWLASGMNMNFKKPVFFGDTVNCEMTITEMEENGRAKGVVVCKNQHNTSVLEAKLTGVLPGAPEREVMSTMLAEGDPTNKIRENI